MYHALSIPIMLLLSASSGMHGFLDDLSAPVAVQTLSVQEQTLVAAKPTMKVIATNDVARIVIPKIHVNAVIREMGVTVEGAMAVPANRTDVGWYRLGTRPGETGSAVIGGHNRWDEAVAVFIRLDELKAGDLVSVVDAKGVTSTFVVREIRIFDALDTNSGIFDSTGGKQLNLITCSGIFNPQTDTYTTRLVVYTDLVESTGSKGLTKL